MQGVRVGTQVPDSAVEINPRCCRKTDQFVFKALKKAIEEEENHYGHTASKGL